MAEPKTDPDAGRKAGRYVAEGRNLPGGEAAVTLGKSRIAFDGSAGSDSVLPGPADLMVAALVACILKNVERLSGMLPFAYRSAGVHVELTREEPPPRITRARYVLTIETDEPPHRVDPAPSEHPAVRHDHQHPGRCLRVVGRDPRHQPRGGQRCLPLGGSA